MSIHFMGRDYASVEEMSPQIRQAYENLRATIAEKYPGVDIDQFLMDSSGADKLTPAWGGQRTQGSVPVPLEFEDVTGLGPSTAVYGRNSAVLFPGFGAQKVKELVLYRDGFAYHTGAKDIHIWRWDEVAVILSDVKITTSGHGLYKYTLINRSGDKLILDDVLENVFELIQPIKRNVFALLLSPLTQQYDYGQAVTFGPVTIHLQNGIQIDGKPHAWNDIMDIKVDRYRFIITLRDSKRHEVSTSTIPNIELLCQMIGVKLLYGLDYF
jgi:Family of unknown function (DUF6585)